MTDLVLLSGGLDSTTAVAMSADANRLGGAIAVDYGQRHRRELDAAAAVAKHYGVPLTTLDLRAWGRLLTGSALTDPTVAVPHGHYAAANMATTVVPNRNATFLMAAVGVAQANGHDVVVTAVHAGDHAVYADCRPAFIAAADRAARLSTDSAVGISAPFAYLSKTEIAAIAATVDAPLQLTWSCYEGGDAHCGRCGTCVERIEAFRDAGLVDPTRYVTDFTEEYRRVAETR